VVHIDDNPSALVWIRALVNRDIQLVQFDDLAAGLDYLDRHGADALMLDLRMEPFEPDEVLKMARAVYKGPTIVLSEAEKYLKALEHGVHRYIAKGQLQKRPTILRAVLTGINEQ